MNRIILTLCLAFTAAIALTSCSKDYNCECTYKSGDQTFNVEFEIKDATKKEADELCTYNLIGATDVECKLN